jgi:hypothetical protein
VYFIIASVSTKKNLSITVFSAKKLPLTLEN